MDKKTQKILLVEDDEFLSSLIRNRLEREGYELKIATDGDQAVEVLKSYAPDLVLLDIILPKKLGFEVMEEVNNHPEITPPPFMIISNLSQEEDVRRAKNLGAVDYFVKAQIMIDDLIKRVGAFLEAGKENYIPE
ncbi:MAG: response regulator [bacterium]|nr:response regulator [bacterium]